jgi:hypothetical protein
MHVVEPRSGIRLAQVYLQRAAGQCNNGEQEQADLHDALACWHPTPQPLRTCLSGDHVGAVLSSLTATPPDTQQTFAAEPRAATVARASAHHPGRSGRDEAP